MRHNLPAVSDVTQINVLTKSEVVHTLHCFCKLVQVKTGVSCEYEHNFQNELLK